MGLTPLRVLQKLSDHSLAVQLARRRRRADAADDADDSHILAIGVAGLHALGRAFARLPANKAIAAVEKVMRSAVAQGLRMGGGDLFDMDIVPVLLEQIGVALDVSEWQQVRQHLWQNQCQPPPPPQPLVQAPVPAPLPLPPPQDGQLVPAPARSAEELLVALAAQERALSRSVRHVKQLQAKNRKLAQALRREKKKTEKARDQLKNRRPSPSSRSLGPALAGTSLHKA